MAAGRISVDNGGAVAFEKGTNSVGNKLDSACSASDTEPWGTVGRSTAVAAARAVELADLDNLFRRALPRRRFLVASWDCAEVD